MSIAFILFLSVSIVQAALLVCIVCSAVLVSSGYSNTDWNYCLAAAIISFFTELTLFVVSMSEISKYLFNNVKVTILVGGIL